MDPRLASEQRPAPHAAHAQPGDFGDLPRSQRGQRVVRPAGGCPDPWGLLPDAALGGPKPAWRIGDRRTRSLRLHPILGDIVWPGKQVNSVEIFSRLPWPFLYSFTSQAFNSPFACVKLRLKYRFYYLHLWLCPSTHSVGLSP